jgi:uncharacterized protein
MGETHESHTIEPLPEPECWTKLAEHQVGRLVVSVGAQPDIFPVNYTLDDGTIVVRTAEGTKLAAALMGQRVAFEIDHIDECDRVGWSVVVHGEARESRTLPSVIHDQDLDLEPWATGDKARFIHIHPHRVTGRQLVPVPHGEVAQ